LTQVGQIANPTLLQIYVYIYEYKCCTIMRIVLHNIVANVYHIYTVSQKKRHPFYFLNNSVKN